MIFCLTKKFSANYKNQSIKTNQLIFFPETVDTSPVPAMKVSLSPDHIIPEMPFKDLTVGQGEFAVAILAVLSKVSLILYPVVIDLIPIFVVEGHTEDNDLLIVESSFAFELVILPLPIVSDFVVGIVEDAFAIHFVFLPFSNVLATFVVEESAFSVPHVMVFSSFIPATDVGLRDILKLLFLTGREAVSMGLVEIGAGRHFLFLTRVVDDSRSYVRVIEGYSCSTLFSFLLLKTHIFIIHNVLILPVSLPLRIASQVILL